MLRITCENKKGACVLNSLSWKHAHSQRNMHYAVNAKHTSSPPLDISHSKCNSIDPGMIMRVNIRYKNIRF